MLGAVIKRLELSQWITQLFTSNEFFAEKPDPTSLHHILSKYIPNHEDKQNVWVVGDSNSDIKWGQQLGLYTYLCDRNRDPMALRTFVATLEM